MNKPKPIKEIHVDAIFHATRYMEITVVTNDAMLWLEDVAHEYGTLKKFDNSPYKYSLYVYPNYDYNEVAQYLERGE